MKRWHLASWRQQMDASRLVGRRDYLGAASVYEQLVAADEGDSGAAMMLSLCYEREGRVPEALALAETSVRQLPASLHALKAAVRLAVSAGHHDKAAAYVRRALGLPEVRTEMPQEALVPRPFLWILRLLPYVPVLRNRIRRDAVAMLEPSAQAAALGEWKRWACECLAWYDGKDLPDKPGPAH